MKPIFRNLLGAATAIALMAGCSPQHKTFDMGSYGYDAAFMDSSHIKYIELKAPEGGAKIMVVPALQGRVMTSTADGDAGNSFGWINYRFVRAGKKSDQFNPIGGEERFWIGPEGGANSYYFKKGAEQVYANWHVPAVIDTESYDVASRKADEVKFTKNTELTNANGTDFKIGIQRTVRLLDAKTASGILGVDIPSTLKVVAYQTENTLTNQGDSAWTKATGLPSIWLLSQFSPTPTTTVFIPYKEDAEGPVVNDTYFGKVPADRLVASDGMIRFKIDGKYRSKIGLPGTRSEGLCGSYDTEKQVLTLLKCTLPEGPADYVNGQWGEQADAFHGDGINAYNDGPVEDGSIMGPFYEIETSSPGAALAPGQSLTHVQTSVHLQGDPTTIAALVQKLFHYDLEKIVGTFRQ
ncbi:MAG: hypothetical protein LBN24_03495 [Mediterranea sp.]|jgi:hypothetical protein|nr:hypothetical protein [Mediterranea sp.]